MSMNPVLEQLQIEISDAVYGLDSVQTQATPTAHPDKWTIQQIVEHLCLTYGSTAEMIGKRLAKGSPTKRKPTVQQRIAQLACIQFGYFPGGRRAPEDVTPSNSQPPRTGDELTCSAADHLTRVDQVLNEAEAIFGAERCVTHQVLGPLSVNQWRRFHLVHGDHHVRQILAIRAGRKI
jgi:hypothetical protein